ncbi:aminotransferase class I/II-fold pyridoxal phosphate-dependent enzyme [Bacteriovoracaceae bacterium]|nr:aminotransferase class I/II-fold pyridoxal phosphate-dependent enzyme [Bacteriovoracaceae bacterium]
MSKPVLSSHFQSISPSAIRLAQIEFNKRQDTVECVNTAIGNVSLPIHPAMKKAMFALDKDSPFNNGVVKYSATVGMSKTIQAFSNVLKASDIDTKNINIQITDGGSQAMELAILGTCGAPGTDQSPLLLLDAAYTNYQSFAKRLGRKTISLTRLLQPDGQFTIPDISEIELLIKNEKPGALVIIPYDNPTGQFIPQGTLDQLAKLCADNSVWIISDEAYRELHYSRVSASSIWNTPTLGNRISIETASKVWNACGLRIGALCTDSKDFHQQAVAEQTANLCANVIGQHIFSTLADEKIDDLKKWFDQQRSYYSVMLNEFYDNMKKELNNVVVSRPDAALYTVVDLTNIVSKSFQAHDFALYCAKEGKVILDNKYYTLLMAPMAPFYNVPSGQINPGRTQLRIAFVESTENMRLVPVLFSMLLQKYLDNYCQG